METATQPMIKANELRLGNWISKRHHGYIQISLQSFQNIYNKENGYELYEPIQLCPEMLEKCGGIKQPDNNGTDLYWFKKDFGIRWLNYSDPIVHILGYDRRHQNIKYIHQLQNLYFAIVGEELKIEYTL